MMGVIISSPRPGVLAVWAVAVIAMGSLVRGGESNDRLMSRHLAATTSQWSMVGNAGVSAGSAAYTSLALGATGTPFVAYRDYVNSYKATVKKFVGTSWVAVGTPGFSAGRADYTSLALGAKGTPYVAYQDYANSRKATVQKFDGTSWVLVGKAGLSGGFADYTSLALGANDTPYVACRDAGNYKKATVKKFA